MFKNVQCQISERSQATRPTVIYDLQILMTRSAKELANKAVVLFPIIFCSIYFGEKLQDK